MALIKTNDFVSAEMLLAAVEWYSGGEDDYLVSMVTLGQHTALRIVNVQAPAADSPYEIFALRSRVSDAFLLYLCTSIQCHWRAIDHGDRVFDFLPGTKLHRFHCDEVTKVAKVALDFLRGDPVPEPNFVLTETNVFE